MLPDAVIPHILRFIVGGLFFSLIGAAIIKFLERKLTFRQAFLIMLMTNFVSGALLAAYTLAKPRLGLSPALDSSVNLAGLALMGFMITRLAANYGIRKEGWFGLGAKVMFAIFLLVIIFMITVAGINFLLGRDIFGST
jgi:hypothetical protein